MRITSGMLTRAALQDLNNIAEENSRLIEQSATGRRINRPSDSPTGAVRELRMRRSISSQQEIGDALKTAADELTSAELGINDAMSIFNRAKELAVQGSTGALSASQSNSIAEEVDQLLQDLVGVANRQIDGKFIFAGTNTMTQPFVPDSTTITAVAYAGNSDSRTVSPSPGVDMPVNLPGDQVFLSGDTFQALIDLRDALRAQDVNALSGSIAAWIDTGLDSLTNAVTRLGALTNSFARTGGAIDSRILDTRTLMSAVTDADLVQTLLDQKTVQTRQQAALAATAKAIQPSLVDYLA